MAGIGGKAANFEGLVSFTISRRVEDLGQVEAGTVTTIIIIPVHVKDLLTLDGE